MIEGRRPPSILAAPAPGSTPTAGCSSPTTGESSSSPTLRTASSTPGMKDSRDDRVVADRERLARARRRAPPGAPRGRAGAREWIGSCTLPPAARISSAVRLAVPDGASSLPSWCSSTISHSGMCAARLLRELHHQHGADREVRRHEQVGARPRPRARRSRRRWCPSRSGRPPRGRRARWRARVSGVLKSTTTSASPSTSASATPSCGSARPTSAMSSAPSTAAQTVCAHAAGRAGDGDGDHAASAGLTGLERRAEGVLVGPHAGGRRAARAATARAPASFTSSSVTASNAASTSSSVSSGTPISTELPRRFMRVERGLHRQHRAALHVLARPLELLRGHAVLEQPPQLRPITSSASATLSGRVPTYRATWPESAYWLE